MGCLIPSVALALLIVPPLYGQVVSGPLPNSADGPVAPVAFPRIEFGVQGDATAFLSEGGAFLPGAGGRLTINVTRLDALEFIGDFIPDLDDPGLWGLYAFQYKRVVRQGDRRRNAIFATVGMSGLFRYYRSQEYRQARPDGSTVVRPAYRSAELTWPYFFAGGVGSEGVVARYAAVRAEVQGYVGYFGLVGVRAVVGVSIPIGGYDVPVR
jgi:hypothetical protein